MSHRFPDHSIPVKIHSYRRRYFHTCRRHTFHRTPAPSYTVFLQVIATNRLTSLIRTPHERTQLRAMIWAKTNGIIKYRQTFQTNFHRTSPLKQKTTNNAHHLSHSAIYAQIYRPILRISRHFSPLPCASVAPLFTLFGTSLLPRFRCLCPLGIRRRLRYVLTIVARIRFAFIRRLCPLGIRRRLRYVLTIVARIRSALIRRLCPAGIRRRLRYVLTIVARIRSALIRRLCPLGIRRRLRYVLTIVARIRSAFIRRLCPAGIRRRLRYVLTIVARIRPAFLRSSSHPPLSTNPISSQLFSHFYSHSHMWRSVS